MAVNPTCQNVYTLAFANPSLWFVWGANAGGVDKDGWNAATPAVRLGWMRTAYNNIVGPCTNLDAKKRAFLWRVAETRADNNWPSGINIGKVFSGAFNIVRTAVTGGVSGLVSAGTNALAGKNDTPRTLYAPNGTASSGPPNPNALRSGSITKPATVGGINPLVIGGVALAGIAALVFLTKGR